MRNLGIIVLSIILLASLGSCSKEENWAFKTDQLYQKNKKSVTIKQGVWGTVTERTGNWMPSPDIYQTAKQAPIKCTIRFYEPVTFDDFQREGISIYNITDVPTKLIAETTSNKNGFFQIKLEPGEYSIFVIYNGEILAGSFDGVGNIGKFSISEKNKTEYNFVVNNAVD